MAGENPLNKTVSNPDVQLMRRVHIPDAFDTHRDDDTVLENVAQRIGFLDRIRAHPVLGWIYRTGVALLGGAIIVLGAILIPAPGPGWLIVFGGLGLLATEFSWAQRILDFARTKVGMWTRWVFTKPLWLRFCIGFAGLIFLIAMVFTTLRVGGWVGFPFS